LLVSGVKLKPAQQKGINMDNEQLKRIADAIEEILRLVKLDQEASKKRWEKESE
jgi:hypothetical protein